MSTGKFSRALTVAELEQVAARFKLLGEPMRLRILQAVCRQPRTVNDIVSATGSTQANVSQHLALLAASGILTRARDGQRVYYGIKDPLAVTAGREALRAGARAGRAVVIAGDGGRWRLHSGFIDEHNLRDRRGWIHWQQSGGPAAGGRQTRCRLGQFFHRPAGISSTGAGPSEIQTG
jgi:ArsR family transcriptional regulator